MDRALLIYTTFPDSEVAAEVADALVRDRLAACVNILPVMRSVYRWKGAVERGTETAVLIKSRTGLEQELRAAIKRLHPYDTPILLTLSVTDADPATLSWILAETGGGTDG